MVGWGARAGWAKGAQAPLEQAPLENGTHRICDDLHVFVGDLEQAEAELISPRLVSQGLASACEAKLTEQRADRRLPRLGPLHVPAERAKPAAGIGLISHARRDDSDRSEGLQSVIAAEGLGR